MSILESVMINGQEYALMVKEEKVVGIKRFNVKHKRWVILRFAEEESKASEELLGHLTAEYLRMQS
ncbi:hypothetical protein [Brevibacillus brevis]|uniref:hypothetical protein n=1 Tax=Brevibacillus brevis TaxID=1393 RepID=UPI0037CB0BBE